jgi:hypothetical protein
LTQQQLDEYGQSFDGIRHTITEHQGAAYVSIFKRRGQWLDHQCRTPSTQNWSGYRPVGDRWQCKCGRVWVLIQARDGFGHNRAWRIVADPNRPEAK